MIQIEEILKSIAEKHGFHKNTTSLKWKRDFLNLNKASLSLEKFGNSLFHPSLVLYDVFSLTKHMEPRHTIIIQDIFVKPGIGLGDRPRFPIILWIIKGYH